MGIISVLRNDLDDLLGKYHTSILILNCEIGCNKLGDDLFLGILCYYHQMFMYQLSIYPK